MKQEDTGDRPTHICMMVVRMVYLWMRKDSGQELPYNFDAIEYLHKTECFCETHAPSENKNTYQSVPTFP